MIREHKTENLSWYDARAIIDKVRVTNGKLNVVIRTDPQHICVNICIYVPPREDGDGQKIEIRMQNYIDLRIHSTQAMLLQELQRLWTSLWMHESLETFIYEDRLPFDPHCRTSLTPTCGDFLTDGQCNPVSLRPTAPGRYTFRHSAFQATKQTP